MPYPLVATAADAAAILPLVAMLGSLARAAGGTRVVVLAVGLSHAEEATIRAHADRLGLSVELIPFDPDRVADTPLRSPHLSRAAYARLFLPDLLPDRKRVLWLDADTIVLSDLRPLWEVDLGGRLVAAVPDDFILGHELAATGCRPGDYVNSGVMVMDLEAWRRSGAARRALAMLADPTHNAEDQSIINGILRGEVHRLGRCWNFHVNRFHEYPRHLRPRAPAIVHFCGQAKPWREETPFRFVFRRFLPAEFRLERPRVRKSLLRRLDLAQRRVFGLMLGRPKHWRTVHRAVALRAAEWTLRLRLAGRYRADDCPKTEPQGAVPTPDRAPM
ncbi:glycosyltransferase [Prosthecomicrobium pneumaticum]|uniref:Lipopolysaccharide biosynthesis glycosyltransferase n=1 Tax=Prosthecomicrobium pneumaticum TaxID=81895 RepID=A0A7W9FNM4_9HYPH|nr:lipopolysaccharide biosynthesis glycosyltransferase [Prosthecomicrobium pneumaticum]